MLVALDGPADAEYGVPRLLHEIPTDSSNTSGLTFGDGSLWLAANGPASRWRTPRPADAKEGAGDLDVIARSNATKRSRAARLAFAMRLLRRDRSSQ